MRRLILLSFLFLSICASVEAQGGRKIQYRADMGFYDDDYLPGAQRLIGHVAFAQDNVRGYCDSAYLYEKENYLVAFGDRVRILVGDSVRLFGRRAYYDGNNRTASIAVRVRLEKDKAYLTTDSLIYDLNTDVGYYLTGGKLISEQDTLTSRIGRYYTKTDDAYAFENVCMQSSSYKVDCDSLQYNTVSKRAFFISPTQMVSKENTILTNSGWYDTDREIALLVGDVRLHNESQIMSADSVYYERERRFGQAWHRVSIADTVQKYVVQGNYVEHYENGGTSLVTDSNLVILIDDNNDSLFLHSDTIKVLFNEDNEMELMRAYNHAKFYRNDLQGACDSLIYNAQDSMVIMFYNPAVWSEEYQLTGDTIRFVRLDSSEMRIDLCKSGFIVGGLFDDSEFNQIKGLNITGFIRDKQLRQVNIVGNAECVYYVQEEDSSLIGINSSITSEMRIYFDDNKIQQIRFYDAPDGKIYPDEQFEEKNRRLQDFRWLDVYRPKRIEDLYVSPIPREKNKEEGTDK